MPGRPGLRDALQAGMESFRPCRDSCRLGGTPPGSWSSFADPGRTPAGLGEDFIVFRYIIYVFRYVSN